MAYIVVLLVGIGVGLWLSTTVVGQGAIGLMKRAETKIESSSTDKPAE